MPTESAWLVLQLALLIALRETDAGKPMSMLWPIKRMGERASTVLCMLHPLADAGLLRVAMDDTRWLIVLLDVGCALPHFTA